MDTASNGIPFLDELRQKWQDGALSVRQVLDELALWEDDTSARTGPELDAAWALRNEIEAASSSSTATVSAPAPSKEEESEPVPSNIPHSAGSWASPNSGIPQSGDDEQVYDSIPRLRDITTQAAAARGRRDWAQIAALRTEAEELIRQQSTESGTRYSMPDDLAAIFTGATEAQEAERLVSEAHAARRKGDFGEAAYRLAEASRLDPRYTPLSTAQQLVSDLQRAMRDLRDNSLTSPEELTAARKLARRLSEEDAAPESEYVSQKLADIEAEIDRRVNAAKQYVDADLAAIEEPGNLDDKLQSLARLGAELGKIEALRPDAPYLPEIRSRYIAARRQLDRLKLERDTLISETSGLDPQKGFDPARVGNIMQKLEALAAAPLAQGDSSISTAAQNLTHRLNTYLSSRLTGNQVDPATLHEHEQLLAVAQRGPNPLSPQQVNTYNAAIQRARNATRPTEAMPVPPTAPLGSMPPSAGTAPRPGSVAPPPRGTMPIPGGGSAPPYTPPPGSPYGTVPVTRPGSTPPAFIPGPGTTFPPHYTPPLMQGHIVTQAAVRKGPPIWAWLLPLFIVLGIGGFFGWSLYQNGEKEKQQLAQATSTAQAHATETAVIAARETTEARETATAIAEANETTTAVAQANETATAQANETAFAESETATAIALIPTPTVAGTGGIVGQVQTVTVDYDVFDDTGRKGMRIHVKFTVDNAKSVPCQATAYFYDQGTNQTVKNTDPKYSSVSGDLAVSGAFTPNFDNTIYDDFVLFMPYEQIRLTGEHKLYFVIQAYVLSPYKLILFSDKQLFNFTK